MSSERGSSPRIGVLYCEYQDALRRFLRPYVRHAADIDDCIQQAFLNVWKQETRGALEADIRGYIFTAVLNVARNSLKRQKNQVKYLVPLSGEVDAKGSTDIEKTVSEREALRLLEAELSTLRPSTRSVFIMYHVEHLPFDQIAARLGVSTRTAEREMARALKHLRTTLGPVFEQLWGQD
jgi:RNA polymerase sigma-70 factor (ECF subfamily)